MRLRGASRRVGTILKIIIRTFQFFTKLAHDIFCHEGCASGGARGLCVGGEGHNFERLPRSASRVLQRASSVLARGMPYRRAQEPCVSHGMSALFAICIYFVRSVKRCMCCCGRRRAATEGPPARFCIVLLANIDSESKFVIVSQYSLRARGSSACLPN